MKIIIIMLSLLFSSLSAQTFRELMDELVDQVKAKSASYNNEHFNHYIIFADDCITRINFSARDGILKIEASIDTSKKYLVTFDIENFPMYIPVHIYEDSIDSDFHYFNIPDTVATDGTDNFNLNAGYATIIMLARMTLNRLKEVSLVKNKIGPPMWVKKILKFA